MKNLIFFVLVILLSLKSNALFSQDKAYGDFSIQLNAGVSVTSHHHKLVSLIPCREGCFAEEQKPKIAPNAMVSIYRNLNQKNSLKAGIGLSTYRYFESGQANKGDGLGTDSYARNLSWKFYSLSIGHRYIFKFVKAYSVFIETELIYEFDAPSNYSTIGSGLAVQPKIGAFKKINDKLDFVVEATYKSAITNYASKELDANYFPYAFGLQLGLIKRI